jgi:hypothetical protein
MALGRVATKRNEGVAVSYTLGEAARATGRNKSTILRAIKAGVMSATRSANGDWAIDAAELGRVYPLLAAALPSATPTTTPDATIRNGSGNGHEAERNGVEIDGTAQLLARLEDAQATIADLRRRLDAEAEERRQTQAKLTALLTDQRSAPPAAPARRSWWGWRR